MPCARCRGEWGIAFPGIFRKHDVGRDPPSSSCSREVRFSPMPTPSPSSHIYLAKANNELISHCRCVGEDVVVTSPAQLDCPWCGCGWLFSCMKCRKAFTFAVGIETDVPWEELARRDLLGHGVDSVEAEDIADWVQAMQDFTKDVKPGEVYVYLDGGVLPAKATPVQFMGWHAMHSFDFVPQVISLNDPQVLEETLANRDYWLAHALPATD